MDFCKGYPMSSDDPTELVTFIRYHGCASHSASSDVLEEVYRRLVAESLNYGKGDYVSMGDICCLFAELRQQTKEREQR
jgi:hypothetical protein